MPIALHPSSQSGVPLPYLDYVIVISILLLPNAPWMGELMEGFHDVAFLDWGAHDVAFLDRGAHVGFSGCGVPG